MALSPSPFEKLQIRIRSVLKVDATLLTAVPADNIIPVSDPGDKREGSMIVFRIQNAAWDRKRGRAECVVVLDCESILNSVDASNILHRCRELLTPKALSDGTVKVALFREQPLTNDDGFGKAARNQATATFNVKFVLGA